MSRSTWMFIGRYAKAHVAAMAALLAWIAYTYPSGTVGHYAAVAIAVGGVIGVWRVPNAAKVKRAPKHATLEHTVTHRVIPEIVVPGKPLGRQVRHDSRSLDYQVIPDNTKATVRWDRLIPVLDQGNVGSCTGNAATGALGTTPNAAGLPPAVPTSKLTESFALALYSAAETIDGDGPYPPQDNGSSGLSVAKAAKNAGLISGYLHITSLAAAQTAIQQGPLIKGSDWYTGMDAPDDSGLVTATGTIRGGHEYEVIGLNVETDLWECVNSWGTSYGVGGHFFMSSATFTKLLGDDGDCTLFTANGAAPFPTPTPTPTPTPVVASAADVAFAPAVAHEAGLKGSSSAFKKAAAEWREATGQ